MSLSNYSSLHAEVKQVFEKTSNAHIRPFVNKTEVLQSEVIKLYEANQKGQVQPAHWQRVRQSLINVDDLNYFKSFGLNEANIKRLQDLINVDIRGDYQALESLRESASPQALDNLKREYDEIAEENSRLTDEIEHLLMRQKMIFAAAELEAEHPGTLATVKRVLSHI